MNTTDDSAEILFQSFLRDAICEHFWHGHVCPLFDDVSPAFPLPTTASSILHGASEDGVEQAVVARDMSEPCEFPSGVVRLT